VHLVLIGEVAEIVFVDADVLDCDTHVIGTHVDSDLIEIVMFLVVLAKPDRLHRHTHLHAVFSADWMW